MKIASFDPCRPKDKTLRLKLHNHLRGDRVTLQAVEEDGSLAFCGNIAQIDADGIGLCTAVSADLGLPLDSSGCVKVQGHVPCDILGLLRPIVEYAEKRSDAYPFECATDVVMYCDGTRITKGDLQRLVAFFKANK